MISVRNHRQRLNGNNILIFLLVAAIMLGSGCNLFKPKPIDEPDYGQNRPNDKDPGSGNENDPDQSGPLQPEGTVDTVEWVLAPPVTPPPNLLNEDPLTGKITIAKEKLTKSSYNVVVMLPFFTNGFTNSFSEIPEEAYLALELYEGIKMGFRTLESQGVNLNVTVMDTEADTLVVEQLLQRSAVFDADLIIGPVTRDNNRIVANFARSYKKNVVSPLNPRTDIIRQNPFYIQVNPSVKTHFDVMMDYIQKRYRGHPITIIAPEGSAGKTRVDYIQEAHKEYLMDALAPDLPVTYFKLEEGATLDVTTLLTGRDSTVVIVPSRSTGFVAFVLRELNLAKVTHPSIVFGMPKWVDFERIDFSYFEDLNVHLTSSGFVSKNQEGVLAVRQNYYSQYGNVPNINVYKGYDMARYFGLMLKDYGVYFQGFFDEADFPLLHSDFVFEPIYDNPGVATEGKLAVRQYENRFVNILRFRDFKYERLNRW